VYCLGKRRPSSNPHLPIPRAPYFPSIYRMQTSTIRSKPNHGKQARTGLLFLYAIVFLFAVSSSRPFMNRTLTDNCIAFVADWAICCRTRHVRNRQLQIFATRLSGERSRPSITNIPATRRSLQRDPDPDRSLFNVYPSSVRYTTASTASLCSLGKLTLVSEPRHISFLLSTCNAPATLGSQIPPINATSGRDP